MTVIRVWRGDECVGGAFTFDRALKQARSSAGGRRARKVRRGDKLGYSGPYGFVHVYEVEARRADAANRVTCGGRVQP